MGLPWIRLDTNLPMHDKIIDLAGHGDRGLAAAFVYVASLAYSGANTTDGLIARGALPFIHGKQSHAKLLVETRLWEPADRGWRIRNWGDRNLVGAAQQAISEALSEAGKKGAAARWGASTGNGAAEANGQANGPTPMATPHGSRNATYGTERNGRLPRLRSVSSSPERAREKEAQARREIEELSNRQSGGAA
jgi:hypothetical protein